MSADIENRLRAAFEAKTAGVSHESLSRPDDFDDAVAQGPAATEVVPASDFAPRPFRQARWVAPLVAAASVAALIAAGWAVTKGHSSDRDVHPGSGGPTSTASQPSPVSTTVEATAGLTLDNLYTAPYPAMCHDSAGIFVHGRAPAASSTLPHTVPHLASLDDRPNARMLNVFGDLNGDGIVDAAAIEYCDAGGVPWPDTIVFYTPSPTGVKILGSLDLGTVVNGARAATRSLTYDHGRVRLSSVAENPGDAACCPSGHLTATLRWNGHSIVASDIVRTSQ